MIDALQTIDISTSATCSTPVNVSILDNIGDADLVVLQEWRDDKLYTEQPLMIKSEFDQKFLESEYLACELETYKLALKNYSRLSDYKDLLLAYAEEDIDDEEFESELEMYVKRNPRKISEQDFYFKWRLINQVVEKDLNPKEISDLLDISIFEVKKYFKTSQLCGDKDDS